MGRSARPAQQSQDPHPRSGHSRGQPCTQTPSFRYTLAEFQNPPNVRSRLPAAPTSTSPSSASWKRPGARSAAKAATPPSSTSSSRARRGDSSSGLVLDQEPGAPVIANDTRRKSVHLTFPYTDNPLLNRPIRPQEYCGTETGVRLYREQFLSVQCSNNKPRTPCRH